MVEDKQKTIQPEPPIEKAGKSKKGDNSQAPTARTSEGKGKKEQKSESHAEAKSKAKSLSTSATHTEKDTKRSLVRQVSSNSDSPKPLAQPQAAVVKNPISEILGRSIDKVEVRIFETKQERQGS
jgi:hypothetical protein